MLPAVAMSLGWGLRGYIGGGPLGAMIPGAMIGLTLCLLLHRDADFALVAAFAAVGVGFGGQETYGQTVHISLIPGTWAWGMTGFTIKGAAWGLLGGAFIGIALTRSRYRTADLLVGLALMIAGTWAGWRLVNQPKLVYFSYLPDKPREELWAGLILGGLLLLAWMSYRAGARIPWNFAGWGALGGGLGFGLGAAIHIWGRTHAPDFPFEWWKTMEFTFGALLGCAYGVCAWRNRGELATTLVQAQPSLLSALWPGVAIPAVVLAGALPFRFDYTIAGAALLAVAWIFNSARAQIAITVTFGAFAYDLLRNRRDLPEPALWAFAILTAGAVSIYVARAASARALLLLLTITAVLVAFLKGLFLPPRPPGIHLLTTELTFAALAIALVWLVRPRRMIP